MKILKILFILSILNSCELRGQEKVDKLSNEDRKIISDAIKDKEFELYSIKKIDSTQNKKTVSYYDSHFFLSEKIKYIYNNNKLNEVRDYTFNSKDKKYLALFSEKKYTYSEGYEKITTRVWREGKEIGCDMIEKILDKQNRPLQIITKSKSIKSQETNTVREIYKYTFNKSQNTETICIEYYRDFTTPKSFEECNTYSYRDGKITENLIGNEYLYDNKNRLIKEVKFNAKGEPYLEELYVYDDLKKSMEHRRYRFCGSKFLVAKDETFYNADGLIQKILYFGISEDDYFRPEKAFIMFYDKNDKEKIRVELKSKTFIEKIPSLP